MLEFDKKTSAARKIGLCAAAAALVAVPTIVGTVTFPATHFVQPARADVPPQMVPASFADLAAKVTPAVVNISSTHVETADDQSNEGLPFDVPKGSPFEQFFKQFMQQQQSQHPMKRKATALGSGFIIDPSGYIVTNNHVIESATEIQVTTNDGTDYPAKLIGADPKTDLALLKIEAKKPLPSVDLGDSDKSRVGD
jgi:serine protease Do